LDARSSLRLDPRDEVAYQKDQVVRHSTLGLGKVLGVDGNRVTVFFKDEKKNPSRPSRSVDSVENRPTEKQSSTRTLGEPDSKITRRWRRCALRKYSSESRPPKKPERARLAKEQAVRDAKRPAPFDTGSGWTCPAGYVLRGGKCYGDDEPSTKFEVSPY
jgi:hypothetical protein